MKYQTKFLEINVKHNFQLFFEIPGNSVLTMTPYVGPKSKYNLDLVDNLESLDDENNDVVVRLPMPQGSLMVLYGPSR